MTESECSLFSPNNIINKVRTRERRNAAAAALHSLHGWRFFNTTTESAL